ncbi:MAG: LamG-like jellyroll fold domain-containing protein, partial [Verrucomicrobiota bacterium]
VRMEEEQLGNRIGLVGQNDAVEYGMINPNTMQWWSPAGFFDAEFGPIVEEWTHVAVVLDDVGYTVFANGEPLGGAEGGGPVSSGDTLNIGGDGVFDNSGNFFLGEIDDVAIWDEALSVGQIQDLANLVIDPLGKRPNTGGGFNISRIERDADGMVALTWESSSSKLYNIQSSPDLTPGSWETVLTEVPGAADAAETTAMLAGAGQVAYYYRVLDIGDLPFVSEDFENGADGWVAGLFPGGAETGTTWEFGEPTNGPGSARGGSGAVGTGLAADYEAGTTITLQTPAFDTLGKRATLDFWYYLDAAEGEGGQVRLLEEDGTLIEALEPLFTGGELNNTAEWTQASIRLPKVDPARPVKVEFVFLSGGNPEGAGWFLDDVLIAR